MLFILVGHSLVKIQSDFLLHWSDPLLPECNSAVCIVCQFMHCKDPGCLNNGDDFEKVKVKAPFRSSTFTI